MRASGVLVVAALATLGCKKESRARRADAPPPGAHAIVMDRDASMVDADPFGELPVLDDLPALTQTPAPPAATAAARKLAAEALKRHLAGDLAGALPLYQQALAQDPGHLMARYNLASAHARLGDRGRALALLKQFRDAACPVCMGRLARAPKDKDWESLWKDPAFVALTARNLVPRADREAITRRIAEAFRKGDAGGLADVLHPRSFIEVSQSDFFCVHDDCGMGDAWDEDRVAGPAGLTKWMRTLGRKREASDKVLSCFDDCCELDVNFTTYSSTTAALAVVCFHTDSGGVTFPDRLMLVAEPAQDF